MENNITYLFGAGASYYACPILYEQADKMQQLADLTKKNFQYTKEEWQNLDSRLDKMIWEISRFGKIAKEFNTIDTYAKKLYLSNKYGELRKLKRAVSMFFTIWSLTEDESEIWKSLSDDVKRERGKQIDFRYINLLANYLEKGEHYPKLKDNIKFVTWNYDLQLEAAFNKFCDFDMHDYQEINKYFPFIPKTESYSNPSVVHLNGFCGFYGNEEGHSLFNRTDSKLKHPIMNKLDFVYEGPDDRVPFCNYINYAWETDSDLAKIAREKAKAIFSQTHILVIVGYSFPSFNHVIDRELFESLESIKKIIYIDPNAGHEILSENFGVIEEKITILKNTKQFTIPYISDKRIGMHKI